MTRAALRVLAATGIVWVAGCREPAPSAPARIRYDGSTSISRVVLAELAPRFVERTGVPVQIERSGAGQGLKRLLAGEVEVAGVSRRLTPDELRLEPYFQIIGYDALAVYVNVTSPVRALTRAQVKALFTGPPPSWRAFGGAAVPVKPCTERLSSERATLQALQALALDGEPYGRVTEREDPSDCLAFVAGEPGGVAVASVTYAAPGVRAVTVDGVDPTPADVRTSRYPLTRPLLLVARAPPAGNLAALFDIALSPEGQAVVARAGFVPAR
jgi:phosphate transport system substrate-binding protein